MLFLRALEINMSIADLEKITLGMFIDILAVKANEIAEAEMIQKHGKRRMATAADIAAF